MNYQELKQAIELMGEYEVIKFEPEKELIIIKVPDRIPMCTIAYNEINKFNTNYKNNERFLKEHLYNVLEYARTSLDERIERDRPKELERELYDLGIRITEQLERWRDDKTIEAILQELNNNMRNILKTFEDTFN